MDCTNNVHQFLGVGSLYNYHGPIQLHRWCLFQLLSNTQVIGKVKFTTAALVSFPTVIKYTSHGTVNFMKKIKTLSFHH
jgi:hypothetical protein